MKYAVALLFISLVIVGCSSTPKHVDVPGVMYSVEESTRVDNLITEYIWLQEVSDENIVAVGEAIIKKWSKLKDYGLTIYFYDTKADAAAGSEMNHLGGVFYNSQNDTGRFFAREDYFPNGGIIPINTN